MLGLLHNSFAPNLYLYRETKHFSYMKGIDPNTDYLFSVDEMAAQISEFLYDTPELKQKAIQNYCFLCFLCGNDFLPHFPSVNIRNEGIPYLLSAFRKSVGKDDLVQGTDILWGNVKRLFIELAKQETVMIQTNIQWKKGFKVYNKNPEDELNNLPLKDVREEYLMDHMDKYYPFLFGQTSVKPICRNYLQMLEWTWNYYLGDCKDYYMYYAFHTAPLFSSLIQEVPCFKGERMVTVNPLKPPTAMTQLAYVLPYADFPKLLPPHKKITELYPQLMETNFPVRYEFCKFFWESHVEFNYIDIDDLNKVVQALQKV
jgi:5'-3' exonuclease